jgi:uncharacterized membrane protein
MIGYILAILTCIFFGLQGAYGKILTKHFPSAVITWATFTFALPFVVTFLFFKGIPPVHWSGFTWATLTSFFINVIAFNIFFKALSLSSLSLTMPFTAFTPLFLIPVAFVVLSELPDVTGSAGILLIILGAYGLHAGTGNLLTPFHNFFTNKGTRYMLIVAVMWSVSATVEKVAILNSSPEFYAVIINLLLSGAYLPYIFISHRSEVANIPKNIKRLFLIGLITAALLIFQYTAYEYLIASYVIVFKRAGAIVSVFLGYLLFKEEKIFKNLIFTALMVVGVILIMISAKH